ncbi:hypothetical protein CLAIMM_08290 [Cladophialophora immunda]|nr:hypothetical protein CLAIMM_08290 [Cladophialophora immunda]
MMALTLLRAFSIAVSDFQQRGSFQTGRVSIHSQVTCVTVPSGMPMRLTFAAIGNGATAIQIAQATAPEAAELKVFIRTPNMCLPMSQAPLSPAQASEDSKLLGNLLGKARYLNAGGFLYEGTGKNTFDLGFEAREMAMEEHYRLGGFRLMFTFEDTLENEEANRVVYDFWARKTRARINDPAKRDIMAPLTPPHPLFAKRPSLEQDYYEKMDKQHVKLVDLQETSVSHVTPRGIVTTDGDLHELDILAIATGFHPITGGYNDINITGLNGKTLRNKWETGVYTYLGLSVNDMPNLFFTYGPQSPAAYSNGPSLIQPQGDWIVEVMKRMRCAGQTRINPQRDAELDWKETVVRLHARSLRDKIDSWYTGANVPGKRREALIYAGGLPLYLKTIQESADGGYIGFDII